MRERYRSILDRNRAWLEEELLIDPFFEHCVERGILTGNDRERIAAFPARPDRVLKFLDILRYKPDDVYDRFLELLGDPKKGQPHIKQHLESAEVPEASGENLEALIKQTLEEFFFVETTADNTLSKEEFLRNFRAGLRIQHKKWLSAEDLGTVFKILLKLFPNVILQRNNIEQIVAVRNICVKPELQHTVENLSGKEPADLQTIPPEEVAFQIRPFFEKLKLDPALSEQFENQDIDGQLLSELTDDNIIELFPKISIGHRLKVAKAVKLTLEKLKKNLEAASRQIEVDSRRKLETYREFDARPKPLDVYEKGFFLPDEQSRPNSLLQPIHRYYMNENVQDFATQTIRFAAACMNDRANGTIHFGVTTHFESSSDCQGGKIVGVPVNKQQFELAITDEIYRAFYDDQREIALMCIRDPVYIRLLTKTGSQKNCMLLKWMLFRRVLLSTLRFSF